MPQPAFRWSRLLTLTAVLVVTAGVAAAPVRQAWLPVVARPLAYWGDTLGVRVPFLSSIAGRSPAARVEQPADLGEPVAQASDRPDFVAVPLTASSPRSGQREGRAAAPAWGSGPSARRGNSSSGSFGSLSGQGGQRASTAVRRVDPAASSSESAPSNAPQPASGGGGSSGGSSTPAPSGAAPAGDAPPIFTEHTAGLPELTGATAPAGAPFAAITGADTNVAVTPEPSTILLFGTGLVAAAGALRRRLR